MKFNRFLIVGIVLIVGLLSSCGHSEAGVTVEDVWARPGLADGNSAVFFVVRNDGDEAEKLLVASSDVSGVVELHKSSMVDGTMKMEMQKFIEIPAGGDVEFKPGDFHVMLIGLNNDLGVGDHFQVELAFESGKTATIDVVVREP